jgi:hypothetical protein
MALRRDVYLPAAESVLRLQALLGSLMDLKIADETLSRESTSHLAAISKISVIGSNKTVEAVSRLLTEYGTAFLDLSFHRALLVERQKRIDQVARSVEAFEVARLRRPDAPEKEEPNLRRIVCEGMIAAERQYKGELTEYDSLQADQRKQSLELLRLCGDHTFRVAELSPPALFAAREEIELPLSQEEYLKIQATSLRKNKALLDAFCKRIEEFANAPNS